MTANKWNNACVLSGIGLLAVLSGGCRFAGGGSLPSVSILDGIDGEKASLALTAECDDGSLQTLSLQFQYNEHGSGYFSDELYLSDVQFHAEAAGSCFGELGENGEYIGHFTGEYCPQPSGQYHDKENAGCGTIEITVTDGGEGRNALVPDTVSFTLIGGVFADYANSGDIQGNIQFIETN